MSDAMSDAYHGQVRDEESKARFDAACLAVAIWLNLDTSGMEGYHSYVLRWRKEYTGLTRVVADLEKKSEANQDVIDKVTRLASRDPEAWLSISALVKPILGITLNDLLAEDSHVIWAKFLYNVRHARWYDLLESASPFAGKEVLFFWGSHEKHVKYLTAIAKRDGEVITFEIGGEYGCKKKQITVLVLPKVS